MPAKSKELRVLLVDDSLASRRHLRRLLEVGHRQDHRAVNGREGSDSHCRKPWSIW